MSMKVKAMIILVIFGAILYLPFSVHAASGNIFSGLSLPILNGGGDGGDQGDSATLEQYAESLPKPASSSLVAQYGGITLEDMQNHMYFLQDDGHSSTECAACHTNRAEFCDKCHNFVGINPSIDY